MESYPITRARIDELIRFLPLFDVPGREFIERWGGGEKLDDGILQTVRKCHSERSVMRSICRRLESLRCFTPLRSVQHDKV